MLEKQVVEKLSKRMPDIAMKLQCLAFHKMDSAEEPL